MQSERIVDFWTRDRGRPPIWLTLVFFPVVIFLPAVMASWSLGGKPAPGFTGMKIAAAPFVWPDGCPRVQYLNGAAVPRACADKANEMARPQDSGLPGNGSRAKQWYRVGNDALMLSCGWGRGACRVYSRAPNKFVVSGS